MPSEEDLRVKLEFIAVYFDALDKRISFIRELEESDRSTEARLLCCCYIDGLGNNLFPPSSGLPNFVRAIWEYGNDPYWRLMSSTALVRSFPRRNAVEKSVANALASLLGSTVPQFFSETDVTQLLASQLSGDHIARFKQEAWRGSIAGIAYWYLRGRFVHDLGGPSSLTFSATYNGMPVEDLTLERLLSALERIASHARKVSLTTNTWFGQK